MNADTVSRSLSHITLSDPQDQAMNGDPTLSLDKDQKTQAFRRGYQEALDESDEAHRLDMEKTLKYLGSFSEHEGQQEERERVKRGMEEGFARARAQLVEALDDAFHL
ncbi:hypothetical protein IAR50_002112 [Cryptococcus sp. DSM 104548]